MLERRYLRERVEADIAGKMAFIAGPRQVGKTTLGLSLPGARSGYLNWDIPDHRGRILRRELPPGAFWFFDEIHKYRAGGTSSKGFTTAARPATHSGDGQRPPRTVPLFRRLAAGAVPPAAPRLHPLSVAELGIDSAGDFEQLLALGGFPEPFFSGSDVEARRWSREYRNLLVREEIAGLERIQDLGSLELLAIRLPELVGSLLSLNALREDLQVSHKTVGAWIAALERLYALFRISPFGGPRIRAIKKAQKHYHFDWSLVPDNGPRFENLIAGHLLKWVHFQQDTQGRDLDLRFFRDTDGREVDFIVTDRARPILAVECKWSESRPDRSLGYWKKRFPQCAAWQVTARGGRDFVTPDGIRVCPALTFLKQLV